ncbi:hypothetical protein WUBG_13129 [Wuchereria bancrofti]|uniref:Uncharacterized protein n=1 Tax=Wuchereria bancrofti TaxID=6293 RepID=J9EG09_WUCBA|nr:hypothetical protein WUBG_13129 [Wuchereria bancrofti]
MQGQKYPKNLQTLVDSHYSLAIANACTTQKCIILDAVAYASFIQNLFQVQLQMYTLAKLYIPYIILHATARIHHPAVSFRELHTCNCMHMHSAVHFEDYIYATACACI